MVKPLSELSPQQSPKLTGVQRLLEAGMLVSCIFALYLTLVLFSFNPADPGWSQTGYQSPIRNMGGAVGAYLSDVLLNTFGLVAYSLPFVIAITGWLLFQRYHRLMELDYLTLGLKIVGFIMLFIGVTAIASMNFDDVYYFSAGGIIGDVVSSSLLPYLSFVGTTLFFLLFIAVGFVLLTGYSWLNIIDAIGKYTIQAAMYLVQIPAILKEKFAPNVDDSVAKSEALDTTADVSFEDFPEIEKQDDPTEPQVDIKEAFEAINRKEPVLSSVKDEFVEIDELIEGPVMATVQEHVSDEEIAAAFEKTPVIEVPEKLEDNTEIATIEGAQPIEKYQGMPSIELLDRPDKAENPISQDDLDHVSRLVEAKLLDFNIQATVVSVFPGPVITRFELDLAPGVKVSKISNLSKDLARALSAISVRVVEVIPGKSVIGLELPNKHREIVRLSEVIACTKFVENPSPLTMVLGKDIAGDPVVVDLAKMPHLLVAGTTGSGKSVGVNTMILSLLYKATPEDVRLIMIDPKMLELSVYEGIPHLLAEVVTDMKEAANALRWCVGEMERRYKLMSAMGVRNLKGFNQKVANAKAEGTPLTDPLWKPGDSMDESAPELEKLPSIVVVVDEFADMMMIVGKKVEELIARIAQKARAAGIHLVLATQRPSVDVITGLIKANIPTRMAFQVSSRIDSRTILDQQGAEQLLGQGDMLYLPPGTGVPTRVHGAFVDDHEVHAVVSDWKQRGEPNYLEEILSGESDQEVLLPGEQAEGSAEEELDTLYDEALAFVTESRRASISGVQRKFRIGYNRAARIIEQMELQGVVSAPGHNGAREVLAPPPVKA
ncbi:DNA translocase FtsK [Thalassotalea eurytherma]|uniref:DNA translocase FtsK n=1 Tax=Thalassotalea eurytherma TaxID=1144278 RepID=A0ABQ6H3U0_9GAMM|nr:DNA translocase FtsK [Thalassotalea eurytherma]GLX82267.1 DNA translocase FtsK [Thalassotalea eurytherma]